jgi:hypothetical protein
MFISVISTLFAQNPDFCAFDDNASSDPVGVYSYSTDSNYLAQFDPVVLNIFFWGINDSMGNPGVQLLTEEQCLTSVSQLNRVYNGFGIFFKYAGMDNTSFKSDLYVHMTKGETIFFFTDPITAEFKKEDSFNIYIASGGTSGFGGVSEGSYTTNIASHYDFFVKDDLMVHEIGHCFNLHHTHLDWFAGHAVYPLYCIDCGDEEFCTEHTTRDVNDPDFNADEAGDRVTDTPAIPNFIFEWCLYNGIPESSCTSNYYEYIDPVTYEYIGPGTDCLDFPYLIFPEDIKNYMAYGKAPPELFSRNFTNGQKVRMMEALAANLGDLPAAITTVEVLYDPYKGSYSSSGSIGTQTPPTFQPGFDYVFMSCGPYGEYPPPPDYNDISFWFINGGLFNYTFSKDILPSSYNTIIHKNNFAIRINQLNNSPANSVPRNCYSTTGAASDGLVIKFEDNVFNTNITLMPQDSTSINSANLINNLQPGLYKIEKNHPDGGVEETLIYKQNN